MMHVGDIVSTGEGVQYCWGDLLLFEYPHGTQDIPPTCIMISPYGTGHLHGTTQAPR